MIHLHKHHEMDWQTWLAIILYGVKGQPWQSIVGLQDISEKEKKPQQINWSDSESILDI